MTSPLARQEVDQWLGRHLGLALDNFPEVKGTRLLERLAGLPRARWDDELDSLWKLLSIPETHFARHPECFDALREVLEEVAERRPVGTVRLWSAGCASGEEAYQLAAIARDVVGDRVEVIGTDFSEEAVQRARTGRYRRWSMRGQAARALQWLIRHDDDHIEVDPAVRAHVTFAVGNLADAACAPKRVDVAFCRNVLIYFSPEGGDRVLRNIVHALRPGGALFLAPTDPSFPVLEELVPLSSGGRPLKAYQTSGAFAAGALPEPANQAPWSDDLASSIRALLENG